MSASPEYAILTKDGKEAVLLLIMRDFACFYRDAGEWIPMEEDDEDLPFQLEELIWNDANESDVKRWDAEH